jgi:hypothetical protein
MGSVFRGADGSCRPGPIPYPRFSPGAAPGCVRVRCRAMDGLLPSALSSAASRAARSNRQARTRSPYHRVTRCHRGRIPIFTPDDPRRPSAFPAGVASRACIEGASIPMVRWRRRARSSRHRTTRGPRRKSRGSSGRKSHAIVHDKPWRGRSSPHPATTVHPLGRSGSGRRSPQGETT